MKETVTRLLAGESLTLGYGPRIISEGLDVQITPGSFTAILGPNACGKSTLLRALSGLGKAEAGQVIVNDRRLESYTPRQLAKHLGMLPQSASSPDSLTVYELVCRGRYAYQGFLRQFGSDDRLAVQDALEQTGLIQLAHRPLTQLSGGQRQRAWIAMVLAQQTELLLLDEPTTYLDLAHQVELLNLLDELVHRGRTVVAVLHDLNLAFRYASHLVLMKDGKIRAQGAPADVVTSDLIHEIFDLPNVVISDPVTGLPCLIPSDSRATQRS
ncbi:ABC transporter ATP-binding protein [Glutamicibacter endophyticus]